MPELPEVETTRRGLLPHVREHRVSAVDVRDARLRYPVPGDLPIKLRDARLLDIHRRAKYLLFEFSCGNLLVHLGMSGSLRLDAANSPRRKHDHVCIAFDHGLEMRLHDPRRFGLVVWAGEPPAAHTLLRDLGPEPLDDAFSGAWLASHARSRKVSVKAFIMDQTVCVGVGNIYASEALFRAGIRPSRAAHRVSAARYDALAAAIRDVLRDAIAQGGTTLRDFVHSDGEPGYFAQKLNVYGRAGEDCLACGAAIQSRVIAQRNTFWCPRCQH